MQILDAMEKDLSKEPDLRPPLSVHVDGGMTKNKSLLELQADILGINLEMGGTSCIVHVLL
jgi:glycerol kinase